MHHSTVDYVSADTGRPRPLEYMVGGARRTVALRGAIAVSDADAQGECALAGLGLVKTSLYLVEPAIRAG
ncbi:LysR family transcriptional regulator, partial [Cupriavidus sp. SIMBA_020]